MKKWKQLFLMSVCFCIFCSMTSQSQAKRTTISDITSESIAQMENSISQAEQQKKDLQSGLTNVKEILKSLEKSKANLANYLEELDLKFADIEARIKELKALIEAKQAEIDVTTLELNEAVRVADEQYEAMKARIKFMYEKGDVYYLELLLSADSYSDFINQNDYINMLSEYDQNMLEEYQAIVAKVQTMKEELEAEYLILDEAKLQVEQEQQALEELIVVKEQEIQGYEADINNREQAIKEYEAEIAAQNELIESLEQAKAEEKKRIAAANGVVLTYDGGAFIWPAPSYTRISDDYGYRIHPILNVQQFHNGVDMAAPKGTSMLAAYDGVVVQAGYSSTMGNYIFIDHGDGLFTIYMHANELFVATDDIVIRGEKIATIGSTGRSTGPHLHFSVRLNGSYVSPWNYLSK